MRKGISPLISIVLIMVFVVAVSSIFMGWVRDYTTKTQTEVEVTSADLLDCNKQAVEIRDVYLTPKPEESSTEKDKYRVTVENIGSISTELTDAFLLTTAGEKCVFNVSAISKLAPGTGVTLENQSCADMVNFEHDCEKFFRVEVKTVCGSEFFNRYQRPLCNGTRVILSEYE